MKKITIIIPAYNEEKRIGKTLSSYLCFFKKNYGENWELLVVLNGCTDNTIGIVKWFGQKHKQLRFINEPNAIGKGGAIKLGLQNSFGELVGYTDADGSTDPEMMNKLFSKILTNPKIDAALGSRSLPGSIVQNKTFFRKITSEGFNIITNIYFQTGIKDTQCGAKVIKKEFIPKILPDLVISGFSFDVNLLVMLKQNGAKIIEIPIKWQDDHNTTIKNPYKMSLVMFLSITRLRLIHSPLRPFMSTIEPVSRQIYNLLIW